MVQFYNTRKAARTNRATSTSRTGRRSPNRRVVEPDGVRVPAPPPIPTGGGPPLDCDVVSSGSSGVGFGSSESSHSGSSSVGSRLVSELELSRNLINIEPVAYDQFLVDQVDQRLTNLLAFNGGVHHASIEAELHTRIAQLLHFKQRVLAHKPGPGIANSPPLVGDSRFQASGTFRLKKSELPQFNGDPLKWPMFWASFEALVMNDARLTNITRYEYLCHCLPEDVANRVNYFSPSDPDLDAAISILKEAFESGDLLKGSLFKLVDSLPRLSRDSSYDQWTALHRVCADVSNRARVNLISADVVRDLRLALEDRLPLGFDLDLYKLKAKPSIDELLHFIHERKERALREMHQVAQLNALAQRLATSKQSPSHSKRPFKGRPQGDRQPKRLPTSRVFVASANYKCPFCAGHHYPSECAKSVAEKREICRSQRLCYKCLKAYDTKHHCNRRCYHCNGKHHSVFCPSKQNRKDPDGGPKSTGGNPPLGPAKTGTAQVKSEQSSDRSGNQVVSTNPGLSAPLSSIRTFHNLASRESFLPLARITIHTDDCSIDINVLIDSGSSDSFLSESVVHFLKAIRCEVPPRDIETFSGRLHLRVHQRTSTGVKSLSGSFRTTCSWLIMPSAIISDLPVPGERLRQIALSEGLALVTPPSEGGTAVIDGLIGMDLFVKHFMCLSSRAVIIHPGVAAVETNVGFVIQGKETGVRKGRKVRVNVAFAEPVDCDRCRDVQRIFADPIMGAEHGNDPLQDQWQRDYCDQALGFDDLEKRYVAKLPWLSGNRPKSNYYSARAQCTALRDRLTRDGQLAAYDEALLTFVTEGAVEVIDDIDSTDGFYLPHRPVYKEGASTSVRPVFNASASARGSPSLNDCLFKGAWAQTQLLQILLRWRLHSHVVFGDLRKAFLQIRVHLEDRKFLRFLWFHEGRLRVFQFTSVIFGANASPFMLFIVLQLLFSTQSDPRYQQFPKSVYMDDGLFGGHSTQQVRADILAVQSILKVASFDMHKWAAPRWLQELLSPDTDLQFDKEKKSHRALGVFWDLNNDTISFPDHIPGPTQLTRRSLASVFGTIFDPMGLLGPVLTRIKLFMRKVINATTTWDQPLPIELQPEANKLVASLSSLPELVVPRLCRPHDSHEVWVFADASAVAYGMCLYIHDLTTKSSQLLMSRGRLASEQRTIPQLELCAAVLAAETFESVKDELQTAGAVRFFSDSTVTICRIQSNPNRHEAFIANRVRIIQKLTPSDRWFHVDTKSNPADLVSRGLTVSQLIRHPLWLTGPSLQLSANPRPLIALAIATRFPSREVASAIEQRLAETPFERLQTVFGTILERLAANYHLLDRINEGKESPVTLSQYASIKVWRFIQSQTLSTEIGLVQRGLPLPRTSTLSRMHLFVDEWGVLRQRRRIGNAQLEIEMKHPIVVVDHPLVRSYALHLHCNRLHHIGADQTRAFINRCVNFVRGSNVIRSIVENCVHCRRMRGAAYSPPIGPLPTARVSSGMAFITIGVDIFGPIFERPQSALIRGRKKTDRGPKYYGLIFVCAASRAVHLELLLSRDTSSIIRAFRRFIGRRGLPNLIYSDNEESFARLCNETKQLRQQLRNCHRELEREFSVRWVLNPPAAPWWGGHYERIIGTVKNALFDFKPQRQHTIDELQTVFIQIEALVNSRPLLQYGDTFEVLTPGHLVYGRALLQLPPIRLDGVGDDSLVNFTWLTRKLNAFWTRWSSDYLTTLRDLREGNQRQPRVGELVIVFESNRARGDWPKAVVTEVFPGPDGIVRVANVRLTDGTVLRRPAQKLVPLEAVH